MSAVTVKPLVPHEFVVNPPMSSSAHVTRKRQVEILPSENSTFSYSTNNRIVINISSQTEFLDTMSGYLRGNILIDATAHNTAAALDEGGVMACFRSIECRTQTGTLIERWDYANRLYCAISNATQSREFIETCMADQLDSIGCTAAAIQQGEPATSTYTPARLLVAGAAAFPTVQFCMKVPLAIMNTMQFLPLFLIKQGLQLIFELERPRQAIFYSGADPGAGANFTFSNVRYVATMITPDSSVADQYIKKYQGDGLHYTFQSWRHKRKRVERATASNTSLSYQFGVRSARAVMTVIQSALLSDADTALAAQQKSISSFLSTSIQSYQYRSGAEEYPTHEVDMQNGVASAANPNYAEAFAQLMLTMNQFGSKLHSVRFTPDEFRPTGTVLGVANECGKLILATDLSRVNSPWSGLDLSINNLDLDLDFAAVANVAIGDRILHTWVYHDVMMSISQDSGVVIRK